MIIIVWYEKNSINLEDIKCITHMILKCYYRTIKYVRKALFLHVNFFYIDVLLWIMCMPLEILLFVNKWMLSYNMKKLYKAGRN